MNNFPAALSLRLTRFFHGGRNESWLLRVGILAWLVAHATATEQAVHLYQGKATWDWPLADPDRGGRLRQGRLFDLIDRAQSKRWRSEKPQSCLRSMTPGWLSASGVATTTGYTTLAREVTRGMNILPAEQAAIVRWLDT